MKSGNETSSKSHKSVERIVQKWAEANNISHQSQDDGFSYTPHVYSLQIGYMGHDLRSLALVNTTKLTDTNDGKLKVMHKQMVCEMLFSYAENILCTTHG